MDWRFSSPVDPHLLEEAGVFTLLPVRRHKDADVAEKAAHGVLEDYKKIFGDGKEKSMPLTFSKDGEMDVFFLPESLPERLAVTSQLVIVGTLYDGRSNDLI